MRTGFSTRLRLTSLVLLALIGTWLGHGVEYGLAAGWRGVALGLWGPVHSYMLPAALLLLVAAFLLAHRLTALTQEVRRRADELVRQLRHGVRHQPATALAATAPREPHPFLLFAGMAAAQLGLYLLQENLEASLAGVPAPGFGAITGLHWTAPIVQLAFAAWLTLGWHVIHRIFRRSADAISRVQAVLHAISRRRRQLDVEFIPSSLASASPWSAAPRAARAPPAPAAA